MNVIRVRSTFRKESIAARIPEASRSNRRYFSRARFVRTNSASPMRQFGVRRILFHRLNFTLALQLIACLFFAIEASAASVIMPEALEAWRGNAYGRGHYVPPPWTPVEVREKALACWGRTFHFGQSPFPSQIDNQGVPMLKQPMKLGWVKNGAEVAAIWDETPFRITDQYVDEVHFESVGRLGYGLVRVQGLFEFDGMVTYTVSLSVSSEEEVSQIFLDIPLDTTLVKYYHYQSWPPASDTTAVKDQVGQIGKSYSESFKHIIWFGDEKKSLAFLADSAEGWLQYRKDRAFEVTRTGDTATVRIRFGDSRQSFPLINTQFKFALSVLPAKPLPTQWRRWKMISGEELATQIAAMGYQVLAMRWTSHYPIWGCVTWGCPIPHDPRALAEYSRGLAAIGVYPTVYWNANRIGYPNQVLSSNYKDWSSGPPTPFGENSFLGKHWAPFGTEGTQGLCSWSQSRAEWMIYTATKALTYYAWAGLYTDEPDPFVCRNPLHQHDAVSTPASNVEARNIFGTRTQFMRLYKEVKKRKPDALLLTNHNSPAYPFFDFMLMGEGEQTAIGLDMAGSISRYYSFEDFRIRYNAKGWGMIPIYFPGNLERIQSQEKKYNRELVGWTLLHDLSFWPVHCNAAYYSPILKVMTTLPWWDAEFFPYWEQQAIICLNDPDVRISYYKSESRVACIVLNRSSSAKKISISMNTNALVSGGQSVDIADAETPVLMGPAKKEGDTFTIELPIAGNDFRLISITSSSPGAPTDLKLRVQ